MFDIAKGVYFKDLRPTIYHGHTTIELRNVKTGIRDRIESDNTFQSDLIAKYLRSMGSFNNSPWRNNTWSAKDLWKSLVGGIYLFKNTVPANSEYMPAGNEMTANGSYGVSSTNISELGSFNNQESVISASSLSMVYDWGTSQGNGDIASVCLGSDVGGYIGYGNKNGQIVTARAIDLNQEAAFKDGVLYKNNLYTFTIDDTNHVLTVKKKKTAVTNASIFDGIETTKNYQYSASIGDSGASRLCAIYQGSGRILIFYSTTSTSGSYINNNATFKFISFDIENDSVTVNSITNNTGVQLAKINGSSEIFIGASETSIFLAQYNIVSGNNKTKSPVYEYKISDGSLLNTYNVGDATSTYGITKIAPNLMSFSNYIIDTVAHTAYPSNMSDNIYCFNDDMDCMCPKFNIQNRKSVIRNPFYLATINNLENAVEKQSTQTMKVIYTLTEAE